MATYYVSPAATGAGTGSQASPWTVAQAIAGAATGDYVWQLAGTYPIAAGLSINTGTYWETYTTTPGDGVGMAVWQATTTNITIATFSAFFARVRGLTADGNNLSGTRGLRFTAPFQGLERVRVTRCNSNGNALSLESSNQYADLIEVDHCSAAGSNSAIFSTNLNVPRRVSFHHNINGGVGVSGNVDCLVAYANTLGCVHFSSSHRLYGAVIANNAAAAVQDGNSGGRQSLTASCVIWGNAYAYGNSLASGPLYRVKDCLIGGNTSLGPPSGGSPDATGTITLAATPFVDATNGDYRLNAYGKTLPTLRAIMAAIVGTPGITTDSLATLLASRTYPVVGDVTGGITA